MKRLLISILVALMAGLAYREIQTEKPKPAAAVYPMYESGPTAAVPTANYVSAPHQRVISVMGVPMFIAPIPYVIPGNCDSAHAAGFKSIGPGWRFWFKDEDGRYAQNATLEPDGSVRLGYDPAYPPVPAGVMFGLDAPAGAYQFISCDMTILVNEIQVPPEE